MERMFAEDRQLPIKIYREPYYTQRLSLWDRMHGTDLVRDYKEFQIYVVSFGGLQAYLKERSRILFQTIEHLKSKKDYQYFATQLDMNQFAVAAKVSRENIYRQDRANKHYVSIDMIQGNFNALRIYSPEIVDHKESYTEWIKQFTEDPYFINSKRERQVLFGHLNGKRISTYMRHLMQRAEIFSEVGTLVSYNNDELVYEIEESQIPKVKVMATALEAEEDIKLFRVEVFYLESQEMGAYLKNMIPMDKSIGKDFRPRIWKCWNHETFPQIAKSYLGEAITKDDMTFLKEGRLCMFLD